MGTSVNGYPDKDKTAEVLIVPEGYQFLPKELFRIVGIPPPLVSAPWFELLNSSEDSREDTIPLATLRMIIKRNTKLKQIPHLIPLDQAEDLEKIKTEKNYLQRKNYVNRKRGRPRKKSGQVATSEQQFENDDGDSFWDSESNSSNFDDLVSGQETTAETAGTEKTGETAETAKKVETAETGKKVETAETAKKVETAETAKKVETAETAKKVKTAETAKRVETAETHSTNENEHDYYKLSQKKEERKNVKTGVQGVKTEDSKIIFPCSECGKSFSAASTLKSHQRIHNGTLLTCSECHKGFVSKYLLKCHMRIHNGDLFMCHKCGRGFITAELLKIHNRAHTGHKPFVCSLCGKSFPTSSNMVQHKQTHNVEKKFLCSECGSSFAQKRCLDYHMIAHSEKKNICNVCGKLWARKNDLIEHMRVHTGVKPYSCSHCPQKFSQASSLKRHQIVHENVDVEKRISCNACQKTFKCQVYYKRHLKKHAQEH